MAWFREWLDGGGTRVAGETSATSAPRTSKAPDRAVPGAPDEFAFPGERFGLPEYGPGSVATLPRRGGQFVIDALLAGLLASLFTYPALPQNWSLLAWAILMVVPVALIGTTPAMVLLGLRVVHLDRPDSAGIGVWALARTFSVFFVIPALIIDRDSRGIQDRVSRTIVLRTR